MMMYGLLAMLLLVLAAIPLLLIFGGSITMILDQLAGIGEKRAKVVCPNCGEETLVSPAGCKHCGSELQ